MIQHFLKGLIIFPDLVMGLMIISNFAMSQYRLEIEITEFRNDKGVLMLQLFDESHNILAEKKGIIRDKKCTVSFTGLKSGKYGVRFFHDEDLSGEMETNLFGKPVEECGYSNNAYCTAGPPSFEKWLFELTENKKIILKPTY